MKASDIVQKRGKSAKSTEVEPKKGVNILDWIADRKNNNKKHMAKQPKAAKRAEEEDEE